MPSYQVTVPDPSGNTAQSATKLDSTSAGIYGFLTLTVASTSTANKQVWVLNHTGESGTPTMADVVNKGTPMTAATPRLPLFNSDPDGPGVDPSMVYLAMKDGEGTADVRGIA